MSVSTDTTTENVLEFLEAHEFDITCDTLLLGIVPCDHPARWLALRSCCGTAAVWCDDCKDEILSDEAVVCLVCDEVHAPARSLAAYIEAINRS